MYIRSLAKNPPTESAASATDVQQEEMAASSDSGSEEGGYGNEAAMSTSETGGGSESIFRERTTSQEDQAGAVTDPEDSLGLVSGSSVSQERQIIQAAPRESAGTAERVLPKTSVASTENKTMESATAQEQAPPAQDYHGGSLTGSTAEAQEDRAPQTGRELHAESVSKILKEFDDLRDAAKAEMEAMRNLMQAERELQEAMASPPPPVYQHRWRGPAYHPHSAYPPAGGYSPYDNRP
ncbi:MAG: hypothetical protein KZQ76_10875 [Candidatus Thiodiazotropha sp. (ex Epidulcina cf. delphinae)]|nr:hypothetical protein [Candidatus Thiodiazotropha sp. (ex Epidulcina cf. delphinae)]